MARTKASVGSKVAVGKSSKARCSAAPPPSTAASSGASSSSSKTHSGGNPVCPRETPKWQRQITNFLIQKEKPRREEDVDVEDTDGKKADSEEEILTEKPKNTVLDESIDLEPLTGEDSHKIEEYYPKGSKGKGVGKKTKGKENKRVREEEEAENSLEFSASSSKKSKI